MWLLMFQHPIKLERYLFPYIPYTVVEQGHDGYTVTTQETLPMWKREKMEEHSRHRSIAILKSCYAHILRAPPSGGSSLSRP